MTDEKREFKGMWIPAMVYYNREVSWSAKIIWAEIDSFTSNDRECFFSNEYLANFLGCSVPQVTRYLTELKKVGWIEEAGFDGRKRYLKSLVASSKMMRQPNQERSGSPIKNDEHTIPSLLYQNTKRDIPVLGLPFSSSEFKAAWDEWVLHRGELKKKLTPLSIKKQFAELARHSEADAIAMIEQSITMGWSGIFELKQGGKTRQTGFVQ